MKNQLLGRVFGCFVAALSLAAIARAEVFVTGDLPRQAALGFRTGTSDEGLVVRDLATESAAAIAGLQDGDVIETINGRSFSHSYVGENRLEKLDGSELATLNVARAGRAQEISFTPPDKPYESIPGADSYYGVVDVADGARLRTIITKPSGTEGPLPAIFFPAVGVLRFAGNPSRRCVAQHPRKTRARVRQGTDSSRAVHKRRQRGTGLP